jgi:hypothetical protein
MLSLLRSWFGLLGLAAITLSLAGGCGDDGAAECVPLAVETCGCPDGRSGNTLCSADMTWGECICTSEDGGTDAGPDGSADAAPDGAADGATDASADTLLPDAGVTWPATPDDYTPGPVSRIASLTIPTPNASGVSDCCRDWGAISKDNIMSGTDQIDNAFAELAEETAGLGLDLQDVLDVRLADGSLNILLDHQGFDGDPDSAFIIAALDGVPDGTAGYLIDRDTFVPGSGQPRSLFEPATLASSNLAAGPGTLTIALPFAGVTLDYAFEDVHLEGSVTITASGVRYVTGRLSGFLRVDDYFGGINDFVSTECACLGLTDPLYARSGSSWTNQCQEQAVVDTLCPGVDEAGCREIGAGIDCTTSPLVIPSYADLDVDASSPGYEALSLGLRFTATPVTITGVTP